MTDIVKQIENCKAVLAFLPSIPVGKFNGHRISLHPEDANKEGCVLHWLFHHNKLPESIGRYLANTSHRQGFYLIADQYLRAGLNEEFGVNADILFDHIASECETDKEKFKERLKAHIGFLKRKANKISQPDIGSFTVRFNNIEVTYNDRNTMEVELSILLKYVPDARPEVFQKVK